MACDLKILIGENKVEFENVVNLSDTEMPIVGVAKAITANNKLREEIISKLTKFYSKRVKRPEPLLGNLNYQLLFENVPIRGGWPWIKNYLNLPEILYIDRKGNLGNNLPSIEKINIGTKEEPKYMEVLILYKDSLYAYRNYLIAKSLVEGINKDTKFDLDFENLCSFIAKDREVSELTIEDKLLILSDFLSKTLGVNLPSTKEGNRYILEFEYNGNIYDTESVLQDLINSLSNFMHERIYKNELFNWIKGHIERIGSKDEYKYSVSAGDLIHAIKRLPPTTISKKEDLDTYAEKISQLNSIEENAKDEEYIPQLLAQINEIIDFLIDKTDKEFPYRVVSLSETNKGKNFIAKLDLISKPLSERYNITHKELQELFPKYEEEPEYRGYDIYVKDGRFYAYKGPLIQGISKAMPYATLDDLKRNIDFNINNDKTSIRDHANIVFKKSETLDSIYIRSSIPYYKGNIIKTLDTIFAEKSTASGELNKVLNGTYKEFINYILARKDYTDILKNDILEKIDTPEKAGLFIYKIIGNDTNLSHVSLTAQEIGNLSYKYYYVLLEDTPTSLRVVGIKPDTFLNLKNSLSSDAGKKIKSDLPAAEFINALVEAIRDRLNGTGYMILIKTAEEISKEFKQADPKARAFLSGKTIIINGSNADITTPLHEYAHVFLGILKATDYQKYRKLVDKMLSTLPEEKYTKYMNSKSRIGAYKGLSTYDLEEEVFADLFSRAIIRQYKWETIKDKVDFVKTSETVSKVIESFFNNKKNDMSFLNLWNTPISIFNLLNSSVLNKLDDTLKNKTPKSYRLAANWIRDLINDLKIIENCK